MFIFKEQVNLLSLLKVLPCLCFSGGDGWGNVLKEMANVIVGFLGVNEDPNAEFPRLTYGDNHNNYQKSDYWLRDGSYLR